MLPHSPNLNALIHAGFVIDEIAEPKASPLPEDQQPVYTQVPIFLGVRATTPARSMPQ
ncbi:MAG: hypothetical protein M0T80_09185 [Actinomycetota bacterium]|nr:hypothetical protein [Actinomycetota bacterium]